MPVVLAWITGIFFILFKIGVLMARTRTYHAEYIARNERAMAKGFSSYATERTFISDNAAAILAARESLAWREMHGNDEGTMSPKQLAAFNTQVLGGGAFTTLEHITPSDVTGDMRHDAVSYFIEWEDMTQEEAIAAMREIYGES